MGKLTIILAAVVLSSVAIAKPQKKNVFSKINKINSMQNTWKAGYTSISELSKHEMQKLLGALKPKQNRRRKRFPVAANLPSEFDARDQWPDCPSISSIKDQGNCSSCWAVSTASAASDRLCIGSYNQFQMNLSAENIMSCCGTTCSPDGGCNGGWPIDAWNYIVNTGVVTGGDYDSNEGCQPYEIPPLGSSNSNEPYYETPACEYTCTNNDYDTSYDNDFNYGSSAYSLDDDVQQIQTDLLNNGPNVACFDVYDDFQQYTSGVYVRTSDKYLGSHAVRVIGWGTDNGVDYWLIANSWNRSWGEDGLFKIRRGTDECGIESEVSGGLINN